MKNKDKIIKENKALNEMRRIGADPSGIHIMQAKSVFRIIKLSNIKPALANIMKEDMLSAGGEAAVHRLCCACKVEYTDILLMGTLAQYKHLLLDLWQQPYGGKDVYYRLKRLLKLS